MRPDRTPTSMQAPGQRSDPATPRHLTPARASRVESVLRRVTISPMDPGHYKGVPLGDLYIEAVTWTEERAEHIRSRTVRYGSGETNLEPEWATEAALDPDRTVRVAGDKEETSSLKVVGYSQSFNGLLKVWIWSDEPQTSSMWNGGSAAAANDTDIRRYENGAGGW